jgi:hypothetical protein
MPGASKKCLHSGAFSKRVNCAGEPDLKLAQAFSDGAAGPNFVERCGLALSCKRFCAPLANRRPGLMHPN